MSSQALIPAYAALADLLGAVTPARDYAELGARLLTADELPAAARELLVHEEHMTERLRAHYRTDPLLRVHAERRAAGVYAREIHLLAGGSDAPIEFGIVRMHEQWLESAALAEILRRERPLGDILVAHDVLRKIEPRWFFRFAPGSRPCRELATAAPAYGRVGIIHCNGAPAIELLEVVPG